MTSWPERRLEIAREEHRGLHQRRLHAVARPLGLLLYIHGLGESCLCFELLMADPRLVDWNQLAPDLRGYGKTGWAGEPPTLEQHADRLADLVRGLDVGPAVVIGHSMGGVIGILMAERHPDVVRALVDVEGNISLGDCGYSSRAAPYSRDDWLAEGWNEVLDQIYAHEGESTEVRRAYGASIQMGDPRAYHLNSQNLVDVSKTETLAGRLATLGMPKIYIHGVPRGTCERSLVLLEQAGVPSAAVESAGHWPFLDQSEIFGAYLADFLGSLPPIELEDDELEDDGPEGEEDDG